MDSNLCSLALHFARQPLLGYQLWQLLIMFLEQIDLFSERNKDPWRKYNFKLLTTPIW